MLKNKWVIPNWCAYILVLVVNALASYLPLNGKNTAEISAAYPVLFTPAGYVFSIWGIIYLFLLGFVIYQSLPQQKTNLLAGAPGGLFVLSSLFNAAWLFAWHYERLVLSVAIMAALLLTLIAIYQRLGEFEEPTAADRWLVKAPFSIYTAWICVATIANVSITLYSLQWNGWGISATGWTVIVLVVATILAISALRMRRDFAFALVFVWSLVGIYVKQQNVPLVPGIALTFALLIVVILLFTLFLGKREADGQGVPR